MNFIKVSDKEKLHRIVKAGKDLYDRFFSQGIIKKYLEENRFDDLYSAWGLAGANILTALFIDSDIEFLPYIERVKSTCFASLPISWVKFPNSIKSYGIDIFENCGALHTVVFDDTLEETLKKLRLAANLDGLYAQLDLDNSVQVLFNKE